MCNWWLKYRPKMANCAFLQHLKSRIQIFTFCIFDGLILIKSWKKSNLNRLWIWERENKSQNSNNLDFHLKTFETWTKDNWRQSLNPNKTELTIWNPIQTYLSLIYINHMPERLIHIGIICLNRGWKQFNESQNRNIHKQHDSIY